MRSLTAEKLKITSAVQNKASKTVVSITQKSDLSTAVWRGVSFIYLYGNAAPLMLLAYFSWVSLALWVT